MSHRSSIIVVVADIEYYSSPETSLILGDRHYSVVIATWIGKSSIKAAQALTDWLRRVAAHAAAEDVGLAVMLRRGTSNRDPGELLSEIFHDPEQAVHLLAAAGFPRARIPRFTTPQAFWSRSLEEARNGVLPGGIRPILEQAAAMYPYNPEFAAYRAA